MVCCWGKIRIPVGFFGAFLPGQKKWGDVSYNCFVLQNPKHDKESLVTISLAR